MDQQTDDQQSLRARIKELEGDLAQRDIADRAMRAWLAAMPDTFPSSADGLSIPPQDLGFCIRPLKWSGRDDYYRASDELGWTYEAYELLSGGWVCFVQGCGSGKTLGNDYGTLHEAQQAGLTHYLDRVRKVVLPQLSLPSPGLDSAHLIAQRDAAEARAKVLQQFIETLLAFQPSEAQLAGAALSFRHDLGLLSQSEQHKTKQVGKFWLQAWQHELRAMRCRHLPEPTDASTTASGG